ncbi:MAG: CBS domain-containing protein [Desulfohalobiaceae bacterium]
MALNSKGSGNEARHNVLQDRDLQALTEQDLIKAMQEISGYLDITPGDLQEVYVLAYAQAKKRILSREAREIMTWPVYASQEDQPLQEVIELLARTGVAGIPVLDSQDRVSGVISEKDLVQRMQGGGQSFMGLLSACMQSKRCPAVKIKASLARDIMSSPPITAGPDTPLHEIFDMLAENKINRVPVVDGEGGLLGVVSRDDLLQALSVLGVAKS